MIIAEFSLPRMAAWPLLGLLLLGCSQQAVLEGQRAQAPDFSGSWEMDYRLSDRIDERVAGLYREIRRAEERRKVGSDRGTSAVPIVGLGGASASSAGPVIALARLAEMITRPQLLEITQSAKTIAIAREESFTLNCDFGPQQPTPVLDSLGSEICGWDAHQLVFRILLPDGLRIEHRLSLAPDGELLSLATTVMSTASPYPFTVNRVYRKFEPFDDGIHCRQTLTRGRVCTTEST